MNTPPATTPVVIELKRDSSELYVEWEDDHRSSYPLVYLRGFCPCAHCQGHGSNTWTFNTSDNPMIRELRETGAYAITIAYEDGHDTGIYTFEVLRELCPCETCRAALGDRHAMAKFPSETV